MLHELCGQHHSSDTMRWFCWARRAFYGAQRAPRRTSEEVAAARHQRGQVIAQRREFNKRKRAGRDARRQERMAKSVREVAA